MGTQHHIEMKNENIHGSFNREYQPILCVNSGDSIRLQTPDIDWGYTSREGERIIYESREHETIWGHPVIGPIAIKNAMPGMTLEIQINDIVPGWYGWNSAGGKRNWQNQQLGLAELDVLNVDWLLDSDKNIGIFQNNHHSFSVKLNPFMGVMSTAPSESGIHSTMPPRYCGGNIDCKELTKGSILYLPIAVEGGLFSVGDGHAAQGDGEVSGTAIECPMDIVDLTLILREDMSIQMPRALTPSGWITFGFHEDLNQATIIALNEMLQLIEDLYHIDRREATALASVVVDLRITQIVNDVKGVHAVLPHGAIG